MSINNNTDEIVLPAEVIELLKKLSVFMPLYMPVKAHNEHNLLKLEILKILKKYSNDSSNS